MKLLYVICFFSLVGLASCKKKEKQPEEGPSSPVVIPDNEPVCEDLPPPPVPFGWYDSIPDKNTCINAFLFDPVDANKMIYVVNGDAFGTNKMFFYDIPSKKATFVCNLGNYLPQVNSKGWITYSDADNNVFLIKGAGNIVQFTTNKHCHNPKWDHTGTSIYYFSEAYFTIKAQLIKVDTANTLQNIYDLDSPHFELLNDGKKIVIVNLGPSTSQVVIKDLVSGDPDKTLLTGPTFSKPGQINFDDLALDKTGQHVFWANSNGIFKCNLSSLKIDTLLKNCPSLIHRNPIISFKGEELTYSQEVVTPESTLRLLHRFRAMELNLLTGQSSEIKVFP